jgi:hypothetical protein
MNLQTSRSTIGSDSSRLHCQHRTSSGRRCRMAVSESDSGLRSGHATQLKSDLDRADVASKLIGDVQEFRSAVATNHCLGELLKLQVLNKISPRRAAVMAYTCNLLLRTLSAIEHELHPEDEPVTIEFGDLPRPDYTKLP